METSASPYDKPVLELRSNFVKKLGLEQSKNAIGSVLKTDSNSVTSKTPLTAVLYESAEFDIGIEKKISKFSHKCRIH